MLTYTVVILPGNISGSADFFFSEACLFLTPVFLLLLPWHPLSSFAKVMVPKLCTVEPWRYCRELYKCVKGRLKTLREIQQHLLEIPQTTSLRKFIFKIRLLYSFHCYHIFTKLSFGSCCYEKQVPCENIYGTGREEGSECPLTFVKLCSAQHRCQVVRTYILLKLFGPDFLTNRMAKYFLWPVKKLLIH